MNNTTEITCPKCGSNQLTANKKGFSGRKAVVGGVLTGGIGLFAGTLGSNKVIITCLNCGNQFRPGAGGVAQTPITPLTVEQDAALEQQVCEFLKIKKPASAVAIVRQAKGYKFMEASNYVKIVADKNGLIYKQANPAIVLGVLAAVIFIIYLLVKFL